MLLFGTHSQFVAVYLYKFTQFCKSVKALGKSVSFRVHTSVEQIFMNMVKKIQGTGMTAFSSMLTKLP